MKYRYYEAYDGAWKPQFKGLLMWRHFFYYEYLDAEREVEFNTEEEVRDYLKEKENKDRRRKEYHRIYKTL